MSPPPAYNRQRREVSVPNDKKHVHSGPELGQQMNLPPNCTLSVSLTGPL